jgi:hypothetical protein
MYRSVVKNKKGLLLEAQTKAIKIFHMKLPVDA